MRICLVSKNRERFLPAFETLQDMIIDFYSVDTLEKLFFTLKYEEKYFPNLVILDESEGRQDPAVMRSAVEQIARENAFLFVSAISSLSPEAFHDAMEGLGMLMPLPPNPQISDVERLAKDMLKLIPD